MDDEPVIRVTRERTGWRDGGRAYTVLVDGVSVGKIRRGECLETKVTSGDHTVQMKLDWETSGEWGIGLANGETAEFVCRPGRGPFIGSKDYYIDLQPSQ